jgi:peptide/nickel transport system permease protein
VSPGARRVGRALAARALLMLATLVVVSIIVYAATLIVPADPARVFLGKAATPAQVEAFRHREGLDRGPVAGYLFWAKKFVRGDWGDSIISQTPVTTLVLPRLARTFLLALVAFLIAAPISILLGLFGGKRSGSIADVGVSVGVLGLGALPEFVIGIGLLLIFAIQLGVLPVTSAAVLFGDFHARVEAYILPALTLALVAIPYMTRQIRVTVREVVAAPYIRAAALRGVPPQTLTWRHVVPTSSARVVNVLSLSLAELMAGVVVVETVFAFPGIGQELVQSINSADVTVVQATALIIGSAYIILNFVADALVIALNPKLRRSHET